MGKGGQRNVLATSKQASLSSSNKQALKTDNDDATLLKEDDQWLENFYYDGFCAEIRTLGKQLEQQQDISHVHHLNKMIAWSNLCAAVGLLTMGWSINLITILGLSTYTFTRWTMIAHHTCHGGYEKVHPHKSRWSRFKFGLGSLWRRFNDWFDWMMPEAWNVEHNNRHHYNLSEATDPDLVEQNLSNMRDSNAPMFVKYIMVVITMLIWKWFYYAPNTYKELKLARLRKNGQPLPKNVRPEDAVTVKSMLQEYNGFYSLWEFLGVVVGPYFVIHFLLTPLPWYVLGEYVLGGSGAQMYQTAICNLFLADLVTNVHGFIAVVTNHAGDDMYRFRKPCRPFSGSFYLRQVLASVDYHMGSDIVDFLHGWLNYQIEHHLWPNLSMKSYQKSAPLVQEICERYGVPYVKQSVFWRLKKTVDIMTGQSSMKWFPEQYEELFLELDAQKLEQKNQ